MRAGVDRLDFSNPPRKPNRIKRALAGYLPMSILLFVGMTAFVHASQLSGDLRHAPQHSGTLSGGTAILTAASDMQPNSDSCKPQSGMPGVRAWILAGIKNNVTNTWVQGPFFDNMNPAVGSQVTLQTALPTRIKGYSAFGTKYADESPFELNDRKIEFTCRTFLKGKTFFVKRSTTFGALDQKHTYFLLAETESDLNASLEQLDPIVRRPDEMVSSDQGEAASPPKDDRISGQTAQKKDVPNTTNGKDVNEDNHASMENRSNEPTEIAAWFFGILIVIFLMFVVIAEILTGKKLTLESGPRAVLGFLCALVAGFAAFFITGTIATQWSQTILGGTLTAQGTGGVGFFILSLVWWTWMTRSKNVEVEPKPPERTSRLSHNEARLLMSVQDLRNALPDQIREHAIENHGYEARADEPPMSKRLKEFLQLELVEPVGSSEFRLSRHGKFVLGQLRNDPDYSDLFAA